LDRTRFSKSIRGKDPAQGGNLLTLNNNSIITNNKSVIPPDLKDSIISKNVAKKAEY
jgi:hypothetical protein